MIHRSGHPVCRTATLLLALCCQARPGLAEPSQPTLPVAASPRSGHVQLVYTLGKGSKTCDGEAMFRRLLAAELRQPDPFVLVGSPTHRLQVRLWYDPPGFRAAIELRDTQGHVLTRREHLERTCADAVDRALIVVMLAVFPPPPSRSGSSPDRKVADQTARLSEARIQDLVARIDALEKVSEEEKRTAHMDFTFAVAAGALMSANLTSNVGPGAWLSFDARTWHLSLGAEARVTFPSPVVLGPNDFDYTQVLGALVPCGRYSYFFGCFVVAGGAEIMRDSNLPGRTSYSDTVTAKLLQLGGRLGAEIPFGESRLGARVWGEVLGTLPPYNFYYFGTDYTWPRPQVSVYLGAGLFLKFGDQEGR